MPFASGPGKANSLWPAVLVSSSAIGKDNIAWNCVIRKQTEPQTLTQLGHICSIAPTDSQGTVTAAAD